MKGGMVHIFIVRQNRDKRNEHIEFVKFRSFRFPLQSPYESAKACSVDPDLSNSFYVSTDLGHFYFFSFPSPTSDAVVRNIFSTSTLSLTSPPLTHSKIFGTNKIGHSLRSFVQIRETKTQSLFTILNVDSNHGNFVAIYRDIETGDWKFLSVINLPGVSGKIDSLQILSLPKPVSSFSSGIFALVAKNKELKTRDYKLYDLRYILSALTTELVFSSLRNTVMSPYSLEHRNVGPYVCEDDPEDDDDFCSWNGYCIRGKCSCFSGFGGKECDKFNCNAVDKCGEAEGRGHCVGANKCKCNSPFYGDSCSHISVPSNVSLIPSELSKNSAIDNDDPEVYVHPTDPNYSVILGTTKSKLDGGIHVWDVEGKELWFQPVGNGSGVNSVDVIYDIVIEGTNEKVDVAIGGIRGKTNGIGVWQIIPSAIETNSRNPSLANTSSYIPILAPLQVHEFDDSILEIYGSCIYSPLSSSNKYVFITTKKGRIFQFRLTIQKSGQGFVSTLYSARNFTVGMGSQLENCVADSENEILFIGEESVGVNDIHFSIFPNRSNA
ncbi:hypothetical protein BKA69DRAFT_1051319 [Paraphysoderma sedebokerense]|nr:hypothetical protein BKA69DRAFT_1051319 [Paraphysoderma sedebokerense]